MNPLPLLLLVSAASSPGSRSRNGEPTSRSGRSLPQFSPFQMELMLERLQSLNTTVDQMLRLTRSLQSVGSPPSPAPLQQEPADRFSPSPDTLARNLPSSLSSLVTPDLMQKIGSLLFGKS
ncbi:MAG: hypothetical protein E7223_07065 [Clostridiales bacterium]|nr:hypothetical protein [Clostridiales bacterium]